MALTKAKEQRPPAGEELGKPLTGDELREVLFIFRVFRAGYRDVQLWLFCPKASGLAKKRSG